MKLTKQLVFVALIGAIAIPATSFAAKGDRKKKEAPAFATVDKDSDGNVTEAEYLASYKGKGGNEAAKAEFSAKDKDTNGKLSKTEFEATAKRGRKKNK